MTVTERSDLSGLGLPLRLAGDVRLADGRAAREGIVRPAITEPSLSERFAALTGVDVNAFSIPTRIFEYQRQEQDELLVRDAESGLPLVFRRDGEVVVNFDIPATQAFQFTDSNRPIYTYLPWFNIQSVPSLVRRPVSNFVQSLSSSKGIDLVAKYRALPLTSFEFVVLLLHTITSGDASAGPFRWPSNKKAVFVSCHDVDTPGFLRRRERDTLFLVEQKHRIRSTWFVPTAFVDRHEHDGAVDFLLAAGHEVGWHGHKHDHRDHVGRFAVKAADALRRSRLNKPANFPTGMRAPRLLKSQHLFEQLERSCEGLRYDTSFRNGIVPYPLWLRGRRSTILEIPTTVPTDIHLYNETSGVPARDRIRRMLEAQITRTDRLIEIGAVISIVTHPEESLSERPDFLDMYDEYLSYVRTRSDIWFATAGEVFKHWTAGATPRPAVGSAHFIGANAS